MSTDNTRRETIEVTKAAASTLDAALASAEPQAREAGEADTIPCGYPTCCCSQAELCPNGLEMYDAAFRELQPRPAPAQPAETEGLVERQLRPRYGACGVFEGYEEVTAAEALEPFASFAVGNVDANGWKADSVRNDRIVDWFGPSDFRAALAAQLAARTQPPEIAEALKLADEVLSSIEIGGWPREIGVDRQRLLWCQGQAERGAAAIRRLLASTGSRQEPAGEAVKWGYLVTVGGLVAQLKTLPQDAPIYGTFGPVEGHGYGVRGVTLSRERVNGRWIDSKSDAPYQHVIWTKSEPATDIALRSQPASRESGEAMHQAVKALLFAIEIDDHYDRLEFLKAWNEGAHKEEWPEFDAFDPDPELPTSHSGSAS